MRHFLAILWLLLAGLALPAQQTVGLFQTSPGLEDGYILFSPMVSLHSFLIDRCGREVNRWTSQYYPGLATYLLPDGSLMRAGRVGNPVFNGGGSGGIIEHYDWDGNKIWEYTHSNSDHHQHHDFYPLPNGNVLILAWEYHSGSEALALGRDANITGAELWAEQIIEVRPILPDTGEIVWEWHLWDHLVQDRNISYPNYGIVANFPGRLDINYRNALSGNPPASPDWIHANSIAYNADLDQIVVNSRNLSESWIIDHSTTTQQASTSTGGNAGKGGDFLYRWGNPAAYDRGVQGDQQLYSAHSTHWIPDSLPGGNRLLIFNNGVNRPGGSYSTVLEIEPPMNVQGEYILNAGQPFGPTLPNWEYIPTPLNSIYSATVSGAQRLADGHTLICQGAQGHILEVDNAGQIYWDYVNPIGTTGPTQQGNQPTGISIFRAGFYAPDYAGFVGHDLTPGDPLEIDPLPLPTPCLPSAAAEPATKGLDCWPNPTTDILHIRTSEPQAIILFDIWGRALKQWKVEAGETQIDLIGLTNGTYIMRAGKERLRVVKH